MCSLERFSSSSWAHWKLIYLFFLKLGCVYVISLSYSQRDVGGSDAWPIQTWP